MKICLRWWNPPGTLENFPKKKEGEVNRDANVSSDEIIYHPWLKNIKSVKDDNYQEEGKSENCRVGLKWRFEDEGVAVYALRFEREIKMDVRNAYTNPGEEIGNGSQVLEPLENCSRSRGAAEVGKKRY